MANECIPTAEIAINILCRWSDLMDFYEVIAIDIVPRLCNRDVPMKSINLYDSDGTYYCVGGL
jgi:hypothetical protein